MRLAREKQEFNEEREKWNKYFEQQKIENTEQSDRLELLSRQLTGTKVQYTLLLYNIAIHIYLSVLNA